MFDLTEREDEILDGQDPLVFVVTYYETLADAQAGTGAIATPTAYQNTSNPQTVYFRISGSQNDCSVTGSFELQVEEPPVANQPVPFTKCDDLGEPNDEIAVFDLTTKDVEISGGGAGFLLSFVPCCGLFLLGGVLGMAAVVTGVLSLTKLKNLAAPETAGPSKGLAIGGTVWGDWPWPLQPCG